MSNRKNRLERGIESIKEQIGVHEEKRDMAKEEGKVELEDYYGKEIKKLEKEKEKKQKLLEK